MNTFPIIKSLINFDKIIDHTTFSSTEITILTSLLTFEPFKEHQLVITLLEAYIEHNEVIISGYNDRTLILSLYHLMKYYGGTGYPDKLESLCLKAVDINKEAKSIYLSEHFFYTLAFLYKLKGDLDKSHHYLYQCINILYVDNTPYKIDRFTILITKNFNIDIKSFMASYIEKNL